VGLLWEGGLDMSTMDSKFVRNRSALSMVLMDGIWDGRVRYVHHRFESFSEVVPLSRWLS
jgi:hypothetical protein